MHLKHQFLTDRIHLLVFDTKKDIASTFLRFQEYYESPKFRGKIFSLEEFKEWYTKNSPNGKKTGTFTYYLDWGSFNIPSYVLKRFYAGDFNPLSAQEKKFLKLFKNEQEPFYIIGINREAKYLDQKLKHEIAHGLFYTSNDYKKEVHKILSVFDIEPIKQELRKEMGYHEKVLDDEVQAYSIALGRIFKMPIPKDLSVKLRKVYQKYLKFKKIHVGQGL